MPALIAAALLVAVLFSTWGLVTVISLFLMVGAVAVTLFIFGFGGLAGEHHPVVKFIAKWSGVPMGLISMFGSLFLTMWMANPISWWQADQPHALWMGIHQYAVYVLRVMGGNGAHHLPLTIIVPWFSFQVFWMGITLAWALSMWGLVILLGGSHKPPKGGRRQPIWADDRPRSPRDNIDLAG